MISETKKVFKFSNVVFNDENKYNVEVELNLSEKSEGKVLSISANIKKGREVVECGQCLDSIYENSLLKDNEKFLELYELWKKYHLNDMHAGTAEQEEALENYWKNGGSYDYDERVNYLKAHDLYIVDYKGKSYTYGSAWLFRQIPEKDLERIESLI